MQVGSSRRRVGDGAERRFGLGSPGHSRSRLEQYAMTSPTVSVVIPTRNRSQLLSRTLQSALNQEEVAVEVVVVDDGSDNRDALVPEIEDTRVRLVRHRQRRGPAAARNTGIEAARAPWVAFLDDDDLWAPHR